MNNHWLYLSLLIGSIIFPFLWSFEKRVKYYKSWKYLFPATIITSLFFIIWDEIFTQKGVWGFNNAYITGVKVGNLPIEEILFFIIIPYCCVFIYACVGYFLPIHPTEKKHKFSRKIFLYLGIFLLVVAGFNYDKLYTFWNFTFTAIFLFFVYYRNPEWSYKFWIAYLYHLIPFFIINGVLTGSFIENQVVWYNNLENLSVRIVTVPIEDSMYSLLLLLMNIYFFEAFRRIKF